MNLDIDIRTGMFCCCDCESSGSSDESGSSGEGVDLSWVTATPETVLQGYVFADKNASPQVGNIRVITGQDIQLENNSIELENAYYKDCTISIANTAPDGDAAAAWQVLEGVTFRDENNSLQVGTAKNLIDDYIDSKWELTYSRGDTFAYIAVWPGNFDNTALINVSTVFEIDIPNLIPENIRKGVMIGNETFIGTYEGEPFDFSAVTATPEMVVAPNYFYSARGELKQGTMQRAEVIAQQPSGWTISAGYIPEKINLSGNVQNLEAENIRYGKTVGGISGTFSGDTTATAEDIAEGKTAAIQGEIITGIAKFESGAGAGGDFFLATAVEGNLRTLEITSGWGYDDMYEMISFVGTYTLVDPGKFGMDRIWFCEGTTANGDFRSESCYITKAMFDTDQWTSDGNIIQEPRWCIHYGTKASAENFMYMGTLAADKSGYNSPLEVEHWENWGGSADTQIAMRSDFQESDNYGPSSWSGRKMVWGSDRNFYATKNAGRAVADGLWFREDEGQALSSSTVFYNYNGRAKIYITGSEYLSWNLDVIDPGFYGDNKWRQIYSFYGNAFPADAIPHPFDSNKWAVIASDYKPLPQFIMDTSGYYPEDTVTENLELGGKAAPAIGEIYNSNATIRAAGLYPA
jgi:hypothetical protein